MVTIEFVEYQLRTLGTGVDYINAKYLKSAKYNISNANVCIEF